MKRVLIVEDQADIRKLIRMTLEFENYEIHEAADGSFGLRMAQAIKPDILLLDVMMPGEIDGLQVCQRIKSDPEMAGSKVVLLTARGQQKDREAGEQAGADEYLVKPFSPLQLIETIERLLGADAA
ncbi:response regulator [Ideonella sp. 4Y11]|uniref:Response regulator n=1 Tax=Ideonella aquatica TaxID=2824119 RepID=A0A940YJA5_9BURK|nr:response regulator [Ideonella aquatica]MBN8487701.1 response regulator [Burkholderiales bacterium]MBQ0959106.1 response regulator [Ideonella aquatica]